MMGLSKRVYGIAAFFVVFTGAVMAGATTENVETTDTQQQRVYVKTMGAITINKDGDATSTFDGISADAAAAGLDRIILHGAVSSKEIEDGTNRVVINWHTLENQRLGNSTREKLENPLHSSVLINVEEIPPQTRMTATGDINSILESFNTIIERENNQGKEENPDDQTQDRKSLSDGGGAGRLDTGSPLGGDSAFDDKDDFGPKTNLLSERQELCKFRVDIPGMKMYKQVRTDTVDEKGIVTKTGECADTGEAVKLEKKYGGDCSVIADPENMVAYQSYRVVSTLDGITQILQDCKMDAEENTLPILATTSSCGVTHDFNNGVTVQQERLFYRDVNGGEVPVRGCADSTTQFEQYVTTATCEPIIDLPNNLVIPQQRIAYKDSKGKVDYATDCAAVTGSGGIAIQTEACDSPRYEHDFTNGQSYVRKRQYYNDYNDGDAKKYLTSCGRSQESYAHLKFTESCSVKHDDSKMRSEIMAVTAINTPTGQIEISPCAVIDTASYVYTGYNMEAYDTVPSVLIKDIINLTGGAGFASYNTVYSWKTGSPEMVFADSASKTAIDSNKCGGKYALYGQAGAGMQAKVECTVTRRRNAARNNYNRYDGSVYKKWDTSIIEQKAAYFR